MSSRVGCSILLSTLDEFPVVELAWDLETLLARGADCFVFHTVCAVDVGGADHGDLTLDGLFSQMERTFVTGGAEAGGRVFAAGVELSGGKDAWLEVPPAFFPLLFAAPGALFCGEQVFLQLVIIGASADLVFLSRICAQSKEPTTVRK